MTTFKPAKVYSVIHNLEKSSGYGSTYSVKTEHLGYYSTEELAIKKIPKEFNIGTKYPGILYYSHSFNEENIQIKELHVLQSEEGNFFIISDIHHIDE